MEHKTQARKVFISHAEKDKGIVDAFVDLLHLGTNLLPSDIFCTSLEGMGIPKGTNFIEYIKGQIQHPEMVIPILSPNYFQSHFCLCELGAAWALSHKMYPLLIPPFSYDELKAVLIGVQVGKLNDKNDLNGLRDELVKSSANGGQSTGRWEEKRDRFLERLAALTSHVAEQLSLPPSSNAVRCHISVRDAVHTIRSQAETAAKTWAFEQARSSRDVESLLRATDVAKNQVEQFWKTIGEHEHRIDFHPEIIRAVDDCRSTLEQIRTQAPGKQHIGGGLSSCWRAGESSLRKIMEVIHRLH